MSMKFLFFSHVSEAFFPLCICVSVNVLRGGGRCSTCIIYSHHAQPFNTLSFLYLQLTVIAADIRGLGQNVRTTTGSFTIQVLDVNDNLPTFIDPVSPNDSSHLNSYRRSQVVGYKCELYRSYPIASKG